jgi:outer membrane protein insertion porin family
MNIGRLLLLMLIPALAFAQQQYYGTTATRVLMSAEADPAEVGRLPIRSGDTITPGNVREAIEVLFSTGRYRSVEVDAVPSANGTQLTFNVVPHYFFSTFSLDPPKLLDRDLSSIVRLPVGQRFSEARLRNVIEQTERALREFGYFEPKVTSTLGSDNARHLRSVALTAHVKSRAIVESVQIQGGEGVLTRAQIEDALDISSGDVFNSAELDKGLAAIRQLLLDKSLLNTPVNAEPVYNTSTNTVRLDVKVDAGQETIIDTGGRIPDDEIRKLIPIFEEGEFDQDLVLEGRARIVEYEQQQGYFEARVEGPDIVPASAGNPLRISFRIYQGERHRVRSIRFEGNTVFSDAQLRERIKVRAAGFPGFLTHGLLSDQLVADDIKTIQNMYRSVGYEAAFVEEHRSDSANHEIDLVFEIIENQRYLVESITISGNTELPESELRSILKFKAGDFYSPAETADARTALMAHYYAQGFPNVRIEATADRNTETGGRQINYQISEGRRYRVGSLFITGNTRTAEKLIKRASGLKEYEYFNPEDVLRAQQKLYATGLFTHVDVVPLDQESGDLRTILIQVEEAKAIVLTPGIGVREDTGPRVTLDISHNNLLGGDRSLGLRLRFGINERQVQATYHEPRLFNHESLDGFGTLTVERTEQKRYQAKRLELALQVRKRINTTNSFLTTASYQRVDLKDFKLSPVVRRLVDLKGVTYISKLGASFISDHRDSAVDPKRGLFNTSTFQIAGRPWGSEVDFISVAHQSSFFKPAGIGTFAISSRVGWKLPYGDDDELPITERYFAGGSTTLRGFGLDEAGPPGGGQLLTLANLEYRIPFKKLSIGELGGALFYDTGNVFERPRDFSPADFTHSIGPGLRFQTPLGPVRFDIGFNLRPKLRVQADGQTQRERTTHLFFTLGHAF